MRRIWSLNEWLSDARYSLRLLRRAPGAAAVSVGLLGIGIGLSAAMYGILDCLLLRAPPHLRDPGRLVRIAVVTARHAGDALRTRTLASYPEIRDYNLQAPALAGAAGYTPPRFVTVGDVAEAGKRSVVTGPYFQVLGSSPAIGRVLDPSDASGPPVAVVSYNFARSRFGSVRGVVGRDLRVDGVRYTVVGVMPQGFSGVELDAADIWTLADHGGMVNHDWRTSRGIYELVPVVRLRPGFPRVAAQLQVETLSRADAQGTSEAEVDVLRVNLLGIAPGSRALLDDSNVKVAVAVAAVVALLMLITVADIANLLLLRALARRDEFAVRAALGASPSRLVRMALTDSAVLALLGGGLAAVVAGAVGRAVGSVLLPLYQGPLSHVSVSAGVCAAVLALATGLATGLVPASLAYTSQGLGALRAGFTLGRTAKARARKLLVAVQTLVSFVLLVGAGLFTRSLLRATREDFGIELNRLVLAPVTLPGDQPAQAAMTSDLVRLIGLLPGVSGVTVASSAPLFRITFVESWSNSRRMSNGLVQGVAPNYLQVTGLRLLRGRFFSAEDVSGSERVTVVDERMVKELSTEGQVLGRRFCPAAESQCLRVIGIVGSVQSMGLSQYPIPPQYYVPLAQMPSPPAEMALLIRAQGDPNQIAPLVSRQLTRALSPNQVVRSARSYDALLAPQLRPLRVGAGVFGASAIFALLLSATGLFSTTAFSVRQRSREFGLRRALGAPTTHILSLVLSDVLVMTGSGVAIGLVVALVSAGRVGPLLYRVGANDPAVLGIAVAVLLVGATLSGLLAAKDAVRANPSAVLRAM